MFLQLIMVFTLAALQIMQIVNETNNNTMSELLQNTFIKT